MGRRGRPAKKQAVPRKPSPVSCSSREPSSSPERSLFQSSVRFSDARIARVPISVPSGSGQPTVGLSWVSVLKSAGKQAATPLTAALCHCWICFPIQVTTNNYINSYGKIARGRVGRQWRRQGEGQISRHMGKYFGDGLRGRHSVAKGIYSFVLF